MNDQDKKRLYNFYKESLLEYGEHDARAVQWANNVNQRTRFKVLLDIARDFKNQKILDVGCGFGDLYQYFLDKNIQIKYTGIDIMPEYISIASMRYPEATFFIGSIDDFVAEPESFDYIFASGSLNFKVENNKEYYFGIIKKMFELCRKGVAFNMLDNESHVNDETYASYDRDEVVTFCETFCNDVKIVTGYLPQDFTIYLYKH